MRFVTIFDWEIESEYFYFNCLAGKLSYGIYKNIDNQFIQYKCTKGLIRRNTKAILQSRPSSFALNDFQAPSTWQKFVAYSLQTSVQISHGYLIIHVAFFFAVMNFVMPTAVLTVVLVYKGSQQSFFFMHALRHR